MAIELVPLANVVVTRTGVVRVGRGPSGDRSIAEVATFEVTGERLNAHLVGAASADWALVDAEGVVSVDARISLETDDGAVVYVTYQGRGDASGGMSGVVLHVAPRFETSDPRYRWLNTVQAVGKGTFDGTVVRYEWYEVR